MFKTAKNILGLICLSYMATTFFANIITWATGSSSTTMLNIKVCVVFMLFSIAFGFLFAFLVATKKKKLPKIIKIFFDISISYTIFYIILNSFALITKKENFWDNYSLIAIMVFSIILVLMITNVRFNSYLMSSIIYFLIFGAFYTFIFVYKANYIKGTSLIISITVFLILFVAIDICYYFLTRNESKKKNKEKEYKSMFN